MVLGAAGVGARSALGGLAASLACDTPAGPSIVVVPTVLFAVELVMGAVVRGRVG
jgi:zinc transport system permease protein